MIKIAVSENWEVVAFEMEHQQLHHLRCLLQLGCFLHFMRGILALYCNYVMTLYERIKKYVSWGLPLTLNFRYPYWLLRDYH